MTREIVVHFTSGTTLSVSREHEHDLQDAMTKATRAVMLRDSNGARNIVNIAHIVRVELRS